MTTHKVKLTDDVPGMVHIDLVYALRVAKEALDSACLLECACDVIRLLEKRNRTCFACLRDQALSQINPILNDLEE